MGLVHSFPAGSFGFSTRTVWNSWSGGGTIQISNYPVLFPRDSLAIMVRIQESDDCRKADPHSSELVLRGTINELMWLKPHSALGYESQMHPGDSSKGAGYLICSKSSRNQPFLSTQLCCAVKQPNPLLLHVFEGDEIHMAQRVSTGQGWKEGQKHHFFRTEDNGNVSTDSNRFWVSGCNQFSS